MSIIHSVCVLENAKDLEPVEGVSNKELEELRKQINELEEKLKQTHLEHEDVCNKLHEQLEEQKGIARGKDREIETKVYSKSLYSQYDKYYTVTPHTSINQLSKDSEIAEQQANTEKYVSIISQLEERLRDACKSSSTPGTSQSQNGTSFNLPTGAVVKKDTKKNKEIGTL